jgi:hypothetical protein
MGAAPRPAGGVVGAVSGSWRGGGKLARWRGTAWAGSNGSYNYFAAYGAIAPWRMAPSSCALRSAQLSTSPAVKVSKPAAAQAQKTQQQQAPTQAPSTKQPSRARASRYSSSAPGRLAGSRPLLASGFWLLASTSPAAAKISKPVAQKVLRHSNSKH